MNDLITLVESQREQFLRVAVDKSIEFDREAGFAVQILTANDFLAKTARNNKDSFYAAINNVAAIGISLNPASKLAYLVPRKGSICLDISYMGLMHIAQLAGAIQWGQAVIVREKDVFELQGVDKEPKHIYSPFGTDRGNIIGVYVVVKTDGSDYLTHTLPISKVHDIRDRSEAWKSYKEKGTKCPWVTDEEEMIKKTCVKQAAKYWPRRERLDQAVHHMNTDGGEGLMLKANAMPEDEFTEWKGKIEKTTSKAAAKKVWKEALTVCEGLGDAKTAERLKDVLLAHGDFIDNADKRAAA
jgi:recombination protein RecT